MEYIHTRVRKSVSESFAGRLRRALDGDTANTGPEHNDTGAFVTVTERGYGSTWTHWLQRTSHLARVYADTPLHFYPLRGFLCYLFLLLRHKNPYTDTTIFRI